jgi:glyoxylase-like metal-dependent hydrolase (beta-lactamase superfamily II)
MAKILFLRSGDVSMTPRVRSFFHEPTFTASHLVVDPATRIAAIIDPVLDYDHKSGRTSTTAADEVVATVKSEELKVGWVLETHAHADHLTAAPYLQNLLGGRIGIGEHIVDVQRIFKKLFNAGPEFRTDGSQFDHLFKDEEEFRIGELPARALHVPGHTPADMVYVIGDAAFVGDTIFMPDYGTARADFPGGDATKLFRSIRRVLSLPPPTRVFLCHDYKAPGRDRFVWETTVAEERAGNIHVHDGVSEDDFVKMRNARDKTLDLPTLIFPSVQVNMRAGRLPPPEDNGISYLKIPINAV